MGVDISTAGLALAMAKIGAVGHISDAMSPYVSDKRFGTRYQANKRKKFLHVLGSDDVSEVKWDPEVVYQASLNHVRGTMDEKRGSGGVFINVMEKLTMGAPTETLRARLLGAMDGGIDGITLSAGLHTGTLKLIEDAPRFRDVNIGIIVSSARALKIFLRSSGRVRRHPDYIIVEGPLAGGHLGFGEDWKQHNLRTIVREVIDLLKAEELDIPVIPAGGVFTGQDALSYMEMGAQAVQVATRFTISEECGIPADVKQEYIRATEDDVVVNNASPTGYLMRMLSNSPSLRSNIKPNCEALGYMLDAQGKCSYRDTYKDAPVDESGVKLPIAEKMCICYHFMSYSCWTCGHYVYRLKDTTHRLPDGKYFIPRAEDIAKDYLYSVGSQLQLPALPVADTIETIAA